MNIRFKSVFWSNVRLTIWVPEAFNFHVRFPVSVKPLKVTHAKKPTKLLIIREKKPLVLRVCSPLVLLLSTKDGCSIFNNNNGHTNRGWSVYADILTGQNSKRAMTEHEQTSVWPVSTTGQCGKSFRVLFFFYIYIYIYFIHCHARGNFFMLQINFLG